jgi:hypothetical protein
MFKFKQHWQSTPRPQTNIRDCNSTGSHAFFVISVRHLSIHGTPVEEASSGVPHEISKYGRFQRASKLQRNAILTQALSVFFVYQYNCCKTKISESFYEVFVFGDTVCNYNTWLHSWAFKILKSKISTRTCPFIKSKTACGSIIEEQRDIGKLILFVMTSADGAGYR